MIETLRQNAREEADRRQSDVLMALEKVFSENQVWRGSEINLDCSYAKHLAQYIGLKKALTACMRKRTHSYELGENRFYDLLSRQATKLIWDSGKMRDFMYQNPCYVCSTCRERKSAWPKKQQLR